MQVFANGSGAATRAETRPRQFTGYVPRTANWGISLTREKYKCMMNWNYRGRAAERRDHGSRHRAGHLQLGRRAALCGSDGEYYFWKKQFAVFAKLRNIRDVGTDTSIFGPSTPAHASLRMRERFGSLWTFGVKGRF